MEHRTPKLLVVDDDPGVIAAYRLILEKSTKQTTSSSGASSVFGLADIEASLFGSAEENDVAWRVTFQTQGVDACREIKNALAAEDPYAAVFLDVRMPPGIDGYETAERIRKLDPNVHIVIVTGYSDYEVQDFQEIAGPTDKLTYLQKPLWPDELRKLSRSLASELSKDIRAAVI